MSAKAQPKRGALQQAKKQSGQQAHEAKGKSRQKGKSASAKAKRHKKGGGKQDQARAAADSKQNSPRPVWGPRNLINVEEGKQLLRGAGVYELQIYTRRGRDTLQKAIKPTAYLYRDLVAMLAQGGFGFAIAEVNNVVNKYATEAISEANKTREVMERAIRAKEEAVGCRIRLKDRGPGLDVEIGSVGGVTTSLVQLVKAVDEAIYQCDVAYSLDAAPHTVAEEAVTRMIRWNLALKGATKVMARYVRKQLPEETIDIRIMRRRVQDAIQNHLKGKHRAADAGANEESVQEQNVQPVEQGEAPETEGAAKAGKDTDAVETEATRDEPATSTGSGFMNRVFGKD